MDRASPCLQDVWAPQGLAQGMRTPSVNLCYALLCPARLCCVNASLCIAMLAYALLCFALLCFVVLRFDTQPLVHKQRPEQIIK